jgi:hypothetical protein
MNTILTSTVSAAGPAFAEAPAEEPVMAEEAIFPRWYYSQSVPAGRVFDDQAALDAASAEGPWYSSPTEAADAAAKAASGETETEPHTRRSHR